MNYDSAIMSFWEGLMVIRSEYVRFKVIASGGKTEIDNKLFCPTYSEIGVDEGYFFLHLIIQIRHIINFVCYLKGIFYDKGMESDFQRSRFVHSMLWQHFSFVVVDS